LIDTTRDDLSARRQCALLNINRSSLYYKTAEQSSVDEQIVEQICEIYEQKPFYGYRKIHKSLQQRGSIMNRKKVQRLMHKQGIKAICPKKQTSMRNRLHAVYPYLLRDLPITRINQAWCTDITYIKIQKGFVYCVALIDIFSRKIMGWSISPFLDVKSCLEALEMALQEATPEIINSDQGCQFTSKEWAMSLAASNIKISMDGKGRWADNITIERFWRSLKYEEIYLHSYETVDQVNKGIADYVIFYNTQRPHQGLDYETPDAIYFGAAKGLLLQQIHEKYYVVDTFNQTLSSPDNFLV